MRFASSQADGILSGSFDHYWVADLYYNGERRLQDVPLSDVSFQEDGTAAIQQSGACTIVWTDEFGRSATPREVTDWFAPFGAQLRVFSMLIAGDFTERVEYGRFEITDVPSASDEAMEFRGQWITTGSRVELELKELTARVSAETFDVPSAPVSLTSAWDEVARISGLPLSRAVADAAIPRTVMYESVKLDAIYNLMDVVLDAVPHMTADGAMSARPNAIGEPVATLTRGDSGCLVSVGAEMSAAQVYNRVVVRATSGDQTQVLAVAEITEGPLRVRNVDGSVSPFGARTYYQSSEYVTTTGQAQAWADSTLITVSKLRAARLPVKETFNPLRERGDVVLIERPSGRIPAEPGTAMFTVEDPPGSGMYVPITDEDPDGSGLFVPFTVEDSPGSGMYATSAEASAATQSRAGWLLARIVSISRSARGTQDLVVEVDSTLGA